MYGVSIYTYLPVAKKVPVFRSGFKANASNFIIEVSQNYNNKTAYESISHSNYEFIKKKRLVISSCNIYYKKNYAFCYKSVLIMSKIPDKRLISFGLHVKNLRGQLNLSQDQVVANSDKLTKATLSDIENGKRNAAVTTLLDLARGLKIHPKKLLDFSFNFDE